MSDEIVEILHRNDRWIEFNCARKGLRKPDTLTLQHKSVADLATTFNTVTTTNESMIEQSDILKK